MLISGARDTRMLTAGTEIAKIHLQSQDLHRGVAGCAICRKPANSRHQPTAQKANHFAMSWACSGMPAVSDSTAIEVTGRKNMKVVTVK